MTTKNSGSQIKIYQGYHNVMTYQCSCLGLRSSQRTRQFFADRPFLFVLYDFAEDLPLFVGKVSDPTESGGLAGPQPLVQRSAVGGSSGAVNLAGPAEVATELPTAESPCGKYVKSIPNALENVKLCEVAEARKMFDWLKDFRYGDWWRLKGG